MAGPATPCHSLIRPNSHRLDGNTVLTDKLSITTSQTLPDGTVLQLGSRTLTVGTDSETTTPNQESWDIRANPLSWTAGQHVTVSLKFPTAVKTPRAISIADASAAENAGHLLFEVTLSRALQNTVKVDFETISGGTATEGEDYPCSSHLHPRHSAERDDRADGLRAP